MMGEWGLDRASFKTEKNRGAATPTNPAAVPGLLLGGFPSILRTIMQLWQEGRVDKGRCRPGVSRR